MQDRLPMLQVDPETHIEHQPTHLTERIGWSIGNRSLVHEPEKSETQNPAERS